LAQDILKVQARVKKRSGAVNIARAFHAKAILAAKGKFRFADDLPSDLSIGFAAPGEYEATVRISNASGAPNPDSKRDLRGIAVRVRASDQEYHDLLMTNFPVPHAEMPANLSPSPWPYLAAGSWPFLGCCGRSVLRGDPHAVERAQGLQAAACAAWP
jgi:hypothetical protein